MCGPWPSPQQTHPSPALQGHPPDHFYLGIQALWQQEEGPSSLDVRPPAGRTEPLPLRHTHLLLLLLLHSLRDDLQGSKRRGPLLSGSRAASAGHTPFTPFLSSTTGLQPWTSDSRQLVPTPLHPPRFCDSRTSLTPTLSLGVSLGLWPGLPKPVSSSGRCENASYFTGSPEDSVSQDCHHCARPHPSRWSRQKTLKFLSSPLSYHHPVKPAPHSHHPSLS